jgi:hypothetical protein
VLESAVTLQFCQLVDAIVLAVPMKRQRVSSLEVVARQLASCGVPVLPVATSPARRRRSQRTDTSAVMSVTTEPAAARTSIDTGAATNRSGRPAGEFAAPTSDVRAVDLGAISRAIASSRGERLPDDFGQPKPPSPNE